MLAAERWPAASVDTARYSRSVPSARPAVSWKTRGLVSSAVPRACHSSEPATRHAKLVSCQVASSTSAATGAMPVTPAPAAGVATEMADAASGALTVRSAFSTTVPSAGTVTDATPSAFAVTGVASP